MYAVVETGSKQYRVKPGDTVEVELIDAAVGQSHIFDRVLLVNNDGKISVGAPTLPTSKVVGEVVEHLRGPKKTTFKLKRRKGYRKTIGHRQELTRVTIKEINA